MAIIWTDIPNGADLGDGTAIGGSGTFRGSVNIFNSAVLIDVNQNTSAIAATVVNTTTNAANIATNVSDIATNAAAIVTVANRVTTNEADIIINSDDIAINTAELVTHDARLTDIENAGMTVRVGANIAPQTVEVTATKVISFDTTAIQAGVGTIWDAVNIRMTATADGIFKLRYESFVSYASNVNITWQIYKNGAPFGNSITLSGQGATVFPLVLLSSTTLLTGDYLELHGAASSSTLLTVVQANGTLEKTHF